jgi:hypothetical protein
MPITPGHDYEFIQEQVHISYASSESNRKNPCFLPQLPIAGLKGHKTEQDTVMMITSVDISNFCLLLLKNVTDFWGSKIKTKTRKLIRAVTSYLHSSL